MSETQKIDKYIQDVNWICSAVSNGEDVIDGKEDMDASDGYTTAAWARVALLRHATINYDAESNKYTIERRAARHANTAEVSQPSFKVPKYIGRIMGHRPY